MQRRPVYLFAMHFFFTEAQQEPVLRCGCGSRYEKQHQDYQDPGHGNVLAHVPRRNRPEGHACATTAQELQPLAFTLSFSAEALCCILVLPCNPMRSA